MKKIILCMIILIIVTVKAETIPVTFDSCIDGDTAHFLYNNKNLKVRFLAINAPEIEHEDKPAAFMGDEAKEFVCEMLSQAERISLEYDNNSDREDKYGRTLAWIWLDDKLLQELLLEKGLAKVDYIYDEYLYIPYLCQVEKKAQKEQLGIWQKEKKLGYCSKVEDNDYTLEDLRDSKLEDLDIKIDDPKIFIVGAIIFFIIFISIITIITLKRS